MREEPLRVLFVDEVLDVLLRLPPDVDVVRVLLLLDTLLRLFVVDVEPPLTVFVLRLLPLTVLDEPELALLRLLPVVIVFCVSAFVVTLLRLLLTTERLSDVDDVRLLPVLTALPEAEVARLLPVLTAPLLVVEDARLLPAELTLELLLVEAAEEPDVLTVVRLLPVRTVLPLVDETRSLPCWVLVDVLLTVPRVLLRSRVLRTVVDPDELDCILAVRCAKERCGFSRL